MTLQTKTEDRLASLCEEGYRRLAARTLKYVDAWSGEPGTLLHEMLLRELGRGLVDLGTLSGISRARNQIELLAQEGSISALDTHALDRLMIILDRTISLKPGNQEETVEMSLIAASATPYRNDQARKAFLELVRKYELITTHDSPKIGIYGGSGKEALAFQYSEKVPAALLLVLNLKFLYQVAQSAKLTSAALSPDLISERLTEAAQSAGMETGTEWTDYLCEKTGRVAHALQMVELNTAPEDAIANVDNATWQKFELQRKREHRPQLQQGIRSPGRNGVANGMTELDNHGYGLMFALDTITKAATALKENDHEYVIGIGLAELMRQAA